MWNEIIINLLVCSNKTFMWDARNDLRAVPMAFSIKSQKIADRTVEISQKLYTHFKFKETV